EAGEPIGVVAQHGAVCRAIEAERGFLHPAQEAHELLARGRAVAEALELEPDAVDGIPHFDRERGAHPTRVGAGDLEAVSGGGGGGGGGRKGKKSGDPLFVPFRDGGRKRGGGSRRGRPPIPIRWMSRHRRAAAW